MEDNPPAINDNSLFFLPTKQFVYSMSADSIPLILINFLDY